MTFYPSKLRMFLATIVLACSAPIMAMAAPYDPLSISSAPPTIHEMTLRDDQRQRDIPLRVYLPQAPGPQPVILFSHGLGGSRENSVYLGTHWSSRGYVAVFMQHIGSDESVWKDSNKLLAFRAMKKAANAENLKLRVGDVAAVLDGLTRWNQDVSHSLYGRLDLERIGMSGHSFGALTTQAVSGQHFPRSGTPFTERRIDAALMLSPSAPRHGDANDAFAGIRLPWLLMTGTQDEAPIGDIAMEQRLAVYPALPPGDKYELVLEGAAHSAFSDRSLKRDAEQRNPNHHRVILALSTAFWDSYLRKDSRAAAWLKDEVRRSVLAPGDQWQYK